MPQFDFTDARVLAIGNASAQTAIFTTTTVAWVTATHDAWLKIGTNPTAAENTAGNLFLPADTPIELRVPGGSKIAAISTQGHGNNGQLSIVAIVRP